jgi:hypothetical protein
VLILAAIGIAGSTVLADQAAHAVTTDLYVTASGSDAKDCSLSTPCLTIGHAIQVAASGPTTVHVGSGTFAENVTPGSKTVTVVGNGQAGSGATTIAPTYGESIAVGTGGKLSLDSLRVEPVTLGTDVTGGELDTEHVTFEAAVCSVYASGGTVRLTDTTIDQNGSPGTGGCSPFAQGSTAISVAGANVTLLRADITNSAFLGVVVNSGVFTATDSTFSDTSQAGNNDEPALEVSGGTATVERSLFADDERGVQTSGGSTTITDSTIHSAGTGIYTTSGAGPTVLRSTLDYAPVYGPARIAGSILFEPHWGSTCTSGAPAPTDLGYNLSSDAGCGFTRATSKNNVANLDLAIGDPLHPTGPADNGGPTHTIAVDAPSAAIDAIPVGAEAGDHTVLCSSSDRDQRGLDRPQGPACDAGAFEVGASATTVKATPNPAAPGSTVSFTATVNPHTGTFSTPAPLQGTVKFTFGKTTLCTKSLSSAGKETCSTNKLPPGRDTIIARFVSSSPYLNSSASTSAVIATAPAFTSPAHAQTTIGTRKAISIDASGKPAPQITIASGRLPKGMHFAGGRGTATIAGTAAAGTAKRYVLHLRAANLRSSAAQTFTLTVARA